MLNLLLFVPLGWLLADTGRTGRRNAPFWSALLAAVAAGALLSLGIELIQLPIPGRDASLGDLAFNTLGAGLGALARSLAGLDRATPRGRTVLAAATAGGAAAVLAGAWLLAPSLPRSEWWGQWTPDLGHLAEYRGRVLAVRVGDLAVGSGRMPDAAAVRARLGRRDHLRVDLVAGPPPSGVASIFSIYDARRREILLLGADGADALLRFRTRGASARFDDPPLRFPRALAGLAPGDTVELGLAARAAPRSWGEGACLSVGGREAVCSRWTPATAWDLLLPIGGGVGRALALAWLAVLFLPAGALAARGRGGSALAVGGVALASLALAPAFGAVGPARPDELAAVAAAAWLPWLLTRAAGAFAARRGRVPRVGGGGVASSLSRRGPR